MDWDARRRYMAREVLPVMAREFELYDPRRHADFDCESCHGADAESRRYAMPNPSLRPLYPTGIPQQQAMVREHPRMVRFMYNHVVPNMQRLLGAAPYDPETGQGFSCFACHPRGSS
ncbi:MAG: hypothetical protein RMK74_00045 [Myxococcales bacterium]|nr:hypothetical protein [Myxococcales bacterium]